MITFKTAPPQHHFPVEIIELILLNLPVNSLLRFRSVSKSWKSMISDPKFIRKHVNHNSLVQTRVMISNDPFGFKVHTAFSSLLSSISDHPIHSQTEFVFPSIYEHHDDDSFLRTETCCIVCPFWPYFDTRLQAFCPELWCLNRDNSLHLWNPSTGSHARIPDCSSMPGFTWDPPVYGLCHDSDNDDYKLLRVSDEMTLLYSLRTDSWRDVHQQFPNSSFTDRSFPLTNGVFVNGAFHWLVDELRQAPSLSFELSTTIVSFGLSSETYKEVAQPIYCPPLDITDNVRITVLKAKLCVFLNYRDSGCVYRDCGCVMWMMMDYGVKKSWTKMFHIRLHSITTLAFKILERKLIDLTPLYVYDDGGFLILISVEGYKDWEMLIYKNGKIVTHEKVVSIARENFRARNLLHRSYVNPPGFLYVESLVAPASYRRRPTSLT